MLAHNKTLAAQLCTELREFFPENAVEYFVSYYDYYQPEAYIASTDTYIEKDSAINDEIDRLRHSATSALSERRDVIIVSSVSCIYSLGDPIDYKSMVISIRPGMEMSREELIRRLIDIQYERNDIAFERNRFRVRGDTVEIWPVYSDEDVVRIEFFGDEVDRISRINPLTGVSLGELGHIAVFPASHYVTPKEKLEEAIKDLEEELEQRVKYFEENGKLIEAQRIAQRTRYDIEMLQEIGFCSGARTIRACCRGVRREVRRTRSSTISRRIFCLSWTRATSRSRRYAPCITATAPARKVWSRTASACRVPMTTVRSILTSSTTA